MPAPLACDMTAIPAEERGVHQAITRRLMASATTIRDLQDGLVFEWPAAEYEAIARFLDYERRCCPFLAFALTVSPDRGPLELRVTGPEGVTAFLRAELHLPAA
jgi:hypothetical protein